jgi:hypothetical protein
VTYLRLLDADAEGADWREVAKVVLEIDPDEEAERCDLYEPVAYLAKEPIERQRLVDQLAAVVAAG